MGFLLVTYAPTIGFTASIIAAAVAFRIVFKPGRGCTDCGTRLGIIDGTHCDHCTSRKRSLHHTEDHRNKGLHP